MVSFDPARYNITPQSLKRWKQQKPLCPQCMQSIDPTLGELLAEGQKADDPLNDRTQYDESVDMPDRIIRAKVRCPNCNKWHWEEINEIDAKGFASGAYSLTCPDCTARMIGPNRQSRP